ncbi:cyclic di-GMP phosphodiesterase response regulator RpfG [bacterium BMS3Abin01]|nr:cyclic di-GMP phosphodiesterase response regulator RpfG [bacterium BMS3Abin01]HDZ59250.1 diguanylate cyclase [Actinomycetota bacterium]
MANPQQRSWFSRALYYGIIGAFGGLAYALLAFVIDSNTRYEFAGIHLFIAPLIAGAFAFVLGREEDCIRGQALQLEEARNRFTSLAHAAIADDDWEVNLHDIGAPTCWKVKGCHATDCPVHGKHHVRCWLIAGTLCDGEVQERFARKLNDCVHCDVYRETIGSDPMNQIGETFNNLIWALSEKEEMLVQAHRELETKYHELEEQQKETRRAAETDALTGLGNYEHFRRYLKKFAVRSRRYGTPLSLLLIDLEHFKTINNEYGFQKGDLVLQAVGALLKAEIGAGDYTARYGGEEFVILLHGLEGEAALEFAENLLEKFKRVAEDADLSREYLVVNIGVADIPDCAADAGSLLTAADTALLFARRKKDSSVAYFRDLSEMELEKGDLDRLGSRLDGAGLETLSALAEAVNASDQYQGEDSEDLSSLAVTLAHDLGMNREQARALSLATKLHDIGKIGVPGSVLRKTGKLSDDELSMVQRHPEIGQRILEEAEQIKDLISAILYHHERWDGMGYPERLRGEQIPLMARIVGIFDAYRAMRCDRPYRRALVRKQAAAELRKGAGTQFDPDLVERFLDLVENDSCELERKAG